MSQLNKPLAIAAGLMVFTTLVHAFVGGPEVYTPLRESDLDPVAWSVLSVVWHVITAVLAIMALGLGWAARQRSVPLEGMIFATQISFAVLFIGYGLSDFGNLMVMPQWTIFLTGSALMLLAGKSRQTS